MAVCYMAVAMAVAITLKHHKKKKKKYIGIQSTRQGDRRACRTQARAHGARAGRVPDHGYSRGSQIILLYAFFFFFFFLPLLLFKTFFFFFFFYNFGLSFFLSAKNVKFLYVKFHFENYDFYIILI
jgi:hypothetical protein